MTHKITLRTWKGAAVQLRCSRWIRLLPQASASSWKMPRCRTEQSRLLGSARNSRPNEDRHARRGLQLFTVHDNKSSLASFCEASFVVLLGSLSRQGKSRTFWGAKANPRDLPAVKPPTTHFVMSSVASVACKGAVPYPPLHRSLVPCPAFHLLPGGAQKESVGEGGRRRPQAQAQPRLPGLLETRFRHNPQVPRA